MYALSALGFRDFFLSRLPEGATPARVAAAFGDRFLVWHAAGESPAVASGRLADTPLGVGDWVWLRTPPGDPDPDAVAVIEGLLPRRTVFERVAAGRASRAQVIAANVDVVFVVTDVDRDFSLRRVERYLVAIRASGARPAVLLNKQDLSADPETFRARVAERCPGVPVHLAGARDGAGLDVFRALGPGETAALVGSSGVGKSTIVNRLIGGEQAATLPIAPDGRGRHTTTHRQLYRLEGGLEGGGILLDTPGMREFTLAGEDGLDEVFDDVTAYAALCRYRDCQHQGEPGCAVAEAIARGDLDADRLAHFAQLRGEARSAERRQDERLRRADDRAWGRVIKEAKRQIRRKRGDWG